LLYSVQTGKSAFENIFGKNLFKYLSGRPDALGVFNEALKTYTESWVPSFLGTYDFSPYKRIADIGGGHGILLQSILEKYPGKTGLLFDLPNVIAGIREEFLKNKIAERCDLMEGDFFPSIPPGCDVYILKKIIHDWDDEHSLMILKNCHKALPDKSRILLLENVIMEDDTNSSNVLLNDIHMMVQTIGGRERTKEEYSILLTKAGFKPTTITRDFVEGIK
jgi:hypothetical protein